MQLDEVIQWARRYGVCEVLDVPFVLGGQSTLPCCAQGRNSIWSDVTAQPASSHFGPRGRGVIANILKSPLTVC